MARTPLMRSLLALARRAALSDPHRMRASDARVSRRTLLAGAGATAALGVLATEGAPRARAQATPTAGAPRIGIVGAGIAGLNAALTLHDAGHAVTLFEAADRVGGRVHSNTAWADGQTSEWCAELIDTDHTSMRELAGRFDLPLVDLLEAMEPGAEDTYYFMGRYYTERDADRDFQPIYRVLREQVTAIGPVTRYDAYTPAGYLFDHMSVAQWIEEYVPGGLGSPLGQL
ncbi:MAG: FAD-dependent oxidoreductase, partial [Phycisphaeraceae bacterium]